MKREKMAGAVMLTKKRKITNESIINEYIKSKSNNWEILPLNFNYTEIEFNISTVNKLAFHIKVDKINAVINNYDNFENTHVNVAFKNQTNSNLTNLEEYKIGQYNTSNPNNYKLLNVGYPNSWCYDKQEKGETGTISSYSFQIGYKSPSFINFNEDNSMILLNGSFFNEFLYQHGFTSRPKFFSIIFPKFSKFSIGFTKYENISKFKTPVLPNYKYKTTIFLNEQNLNITNPELVSFIPNTFESHSIYLNNNLSKKTTEIPSNIINQNYTYFVSTLPYLTTEQSFLINDSLIQQDNNYNSIQDIEINSNNTLKIYGIEQLFNQPIYLIRMLKKTQTPLNIQISGNFFTLPKMPLSSSLMVSLSSIPSYSSNAISHGNVHININTANWNYYFPIDEIYSKTTSVTDSTTINSEIISHENLWQITKTVRVIILRTSPSAYASNNITFTESPFSSYLEGFYNAITAFRGTKGENYRLIIYLFNVPYKTGFIKYIGISNTLNGIDEKSFMFPLFYKNHYEEAFLILQRPNEHEIYIHVKNYGFSFKIDSEIMPYEKISFTTLLLDPPILKSSELQVLPSTFAMNGKRVVSFSGLLKRHYTYFSRPSSNAPLNFGKNIHENVINLNENLMAKTSRKPIGWLNNDNTEINGINNELIKNRAEYFVLSEFEVIYMIEKQENCKMIRTPWKLKDENNIDNYMLIIQSGNLEDFFKIMGKVNNYEVKNVHAQLNITNSTGGYSKFVSKILLNDNIIEELTELSVIVIKFTFPNINLNFSTSITQESNLPYYTVYWKNKLLPDITKVSYPISALGLILIINHQGLLCDANGMVPLGPKIENDLFLCAYVLNSSSLLSKHISIASSSHRMLPYGRSPGVVTTIKKNTAPITIGSEIFPCDNYMFEDCDNIQLTSGTNYANVYYLEMPAVGQPQSKTISGTTYRHSISGCVNSTVDIFFAWKTNGNDTSIINFIKNSICVMPGYHNHVTGSLPNSATSQLHEADTTSTNGTTMPLRYISATSATYGTRGVKNGTRFLELPTINSTTAFTGFSSGRGVFLWFNLATSTAHLQLTGQINKRINTKFKRNDEQTQTTIPINGEPISNFSTSFTSATNGLQDLKVLTLTYQEISASMNYDSNVESLGQNFAMQYIIPTSTPYVVQGAKKYETGFAHRNLTYPMYAYFAPTIMVKGTPPQNLVIYYKRYQGVFHGFNNGSAFLAPEQLKSDSILPPELIYNQNSITAQGFLQIGFNNQDTYIQSPYWLDHTVNDTSILQNNMKVNGFGYYDDAVISGPSIIN